MKCTHYVSSTLLFTMFNHILCCRWWSSTHPISDYNIILCSIATELEQSFSYNDLPQCLAAHLYLKKKINNNNTLSIPLQDTILYDITSVPCVPNGRPWVIINYHFLFSPRYCRPLKLHAV